MPGADVGLRAEDPTIAELLKPLGYATGQFGKNHLGDRDEFLPTVHGFDEFFGNLYHLNAEEEPELPDYPPARTSRTSTSASAPRGVLHCRATDRRRHRGPRCGRVGKQRIEDTGPADQEADGDDRRRDLRRTRSTSSSARPAPDKPFFVLVQHDAHAPAHAPEAGEHRAGRALAVALPRRDDRARQPGRHAARQARRARHRRRHDRRSTRPTTGRT